MADINWTGNTLNVADGALASTSMRYHELALQWWLNKLFLLRWGVPVPVVFTSPMDAFSLFSQMWSEANNPFQYLLDVKDECGNPVYQPYPQPVRYPVISVYRKGWKYRQAHNFSIHRMRYLNWPTVSSTGPGLYGVANNGTNLTRCNLAEVTTSRYPMAFDYRFQIDHFCNRPDTQAFFLNQLFREFWRTGGTVMQTWIRVNYPGMGNKLVRLYIDGDVDSMTPEEPPQGQNVEFRTSFTVAVEGYDIDLDYKIYPALWTILMRQGSADPTALNAAFEFTGTFDLRENPANPTVDYRQETTVMPPEGTCADDLRRERFQAYQVHEIQFNSLAVQPVPNTAAVPPGYPAASGVTAFGQGTISAIGNIVDGGTHAEAVTQGSGFYAGTYTVVVVESGSYSESSTQSSGFYAGTYV